MQETLAHNKNFLKLSYWYKHIGELSLKSISCGLSPHPEAPFILSLTIDWCSLKLFTLTVTADSVLQGLQSPLSQPTLDHLHKHRNLHHLVVPFQHPGGMIPFFLQKERMKIQIYFRVTSKLQNREPKEIIAIPNFNIYPMHQFEVIINLISYNFITHLMPEMFLLKEDRDPSLQLEIPTPYKHIPSIGIYLNELLLMKMPLVDQSEGENLPLQPPLLYCK